MGDTTCLKCGAKCGEDALFCVSCGAKIACGDGRKVGKEVGRGGPGSLDPRTQRASSTSIDTSFTRNSTVVSDGPIDSSFIKNATVNIDQSASREAPPDGQRGDTKISGSFIKDSEIVIDNSVETHTHISYISDALKDKEIEYRKLISQFLKQSGLSGIYQQIDALNARGEALGLSLGDVVQIRKEIMDAYENETVQRKAYELSRKRYRIRGKNGVIEEEPKTRDEVVGFLNQDIYRNYVPMIERDMDGQWIPVWKLDEFARNPGVALVCCLTADRLNPGEVSVCVDCGKVFRKKFVNDDGRCGVCAERALRQAVTSRAPKEEKVDLSRLDPAMWKRVPPGVFMMGSPNDEPGRQNDELLHQVRITRGLLVYSTQVTEGTYAEAMGGKDGRKDMPKVNVSWYEAILFCNEYSRKLDLPACYEVTGTGENPVVNWDRSVAGIRLLTEAEWEYCSRAGNTGRFHRADEDNLYRSVVYDSEELEEVGVREPNKYGLHDMLGTVLEWIWDSRGPYAADPVADPVPQQDNIFKGLRGGSYMDKMEDCRCARRYFASASSKSGVYGFRICVSCPE